MAKKQKKPRVTKAQDTKPLTLGGRSSDRELLELEAFAQHFKQQRIKHGKPKGWDSVLVVPRMSTRFWAMQSMWSRATHVTVVRDRACHCGPGSYMPLRTGTVHVNVIWTTHVNAFQCGPDSA